MRILLLSLLIIAGGCADTERRALEKDTSVSHVLDNYHDAANYLAAKSGFIAICRASLEINNRGERGYERGQCGRVIEISGQIKEAVSIWRTASKLEQQQWFERHPYEFRDMQNAIIDYDAIVQFVADIDGI